LVSKSIAKQQNSSDVDKLEELEQKVRDLMNKLHEYNLELLEKNDLLNLLLTSVSFEVFIGLNLRAFIMLFIIITSMPVVSFSF
jgi:hypothetical protein